MTRLMQWVRAQFGNTPKADRADHRYEAAILLADEVTAKMRERANSIHPFRQVLSEMLFTQQPRDPFVIADAYEVMEESHIFRGVNGG